jgi:proline dehydrogenase
MINKLIAHVVPVMPKDLVWIFSKKYIAGKSVDSAIAVSKNLNQQNILVTLDVLGEFISYLTEARENKNEYLSLIEKVSEQDIRGSFSVKPTSFGLLLDEEICYQNIREIVLMAKEHDRFIRIDMEDSQCLEKELNLFKRLYAEFPEYVGIVLQAYMRRTLSDIDGLKKISIPNHPVNIRLCKGIYIEPEEIAYQSKNNVNQNFILCLEQIIRHGMFPAIATHDKKLIKQSFELIRRYGLNNEQYEFQMLHGVTPKLRQDIVNRGNTMRVYVPFGEHWFGYSTRRLQENPKIVTHIVKSLFVKN